MNIKQKTIQGVFWAAIQNWGSQAGSLLVFIILARLLSPGDFGLVALANVIIIFTQVFVEQGLAAALIQRPELSSKYINTVFWTQIFLACVLTTITFISASLLAEIFHQPQLTSIIQWLSILFVISALGHTQRALVKRKFNFQVLANAALLGIFLAGIVGIFMAFNGWGAWSLVGQQMTYESVEVIVLWWANSWRPKWQFSETHLFEVLHFSINLLGEKLVVFFNQRTDQLLIGYFLGEVALGYYAIAHRILQVMTQLLIETIIQVALPTLSRLQNDSQRFLDTLYRGTLFTSLIAFPVFLGVIILAPEIVTILFGEKWREAIPILQILIFAGIIRAVSLFQRAAYVAMGKPSLQFKLGLLNAIFNLIACLLAVKWGILAVAMAYVLSDYLVFPIGQWLLTKVIAISWKTYLSQFLAPITCTIIMTLMIFITQYLVTPLVPPQINLLICSMIGSISYILALKLIFPQLFSQLLTLATLLRSS